MTVVLADAIRIKCGELFGFGANGCFDIVTDFFPVAIDVDAADFAAAITEMPMRLFVTGAVITVNI